MNDEDFYDLIDKKLFDNRIHRLVGASMIAFMDTLLASVDKQKFQHSKFTPTEVNNYAFAKMIDKLDHFRKVGNEAGAAFDKAADGGLDLKKVQDLVDKYGEALH